VGLTWSEESRRYIDSPPEFFWPDKWRKRAENVKQGSTDEEVEYESLWQFDSIQEDANSLLEDSVKLYNHMLDSGVAPEQARMILPQNMYVNWVWTGSLLAFYQLYKLRTGHGAQMEAQHFANQLEAVVAPLYPASWAALKEYA
jgi:thymidylate synthase (FAD)